MASLSYIFLPKYAPKTKIGILVSAISVSEYAPGLTVLKHSRTSTVIAIKTMVLSPPCFFSIKLNINGKNIYITNIKATNQMVFLPSYQNPKVLKSYINMLIPLSSWMTSMINHAIEAYIRYGINTLTNLFL